jgi:hypothetical protein
MEGKKYRCDKGYHATLGHAFAQVFGKGLTALFLSMTFKSVMTVTACEKLTGLATD